MRVGGGAVREWQVTAVAGMESVGVEGPFAGAGEEVVGTREEAVGAGGVAVGAGWAVARAGGVSKLRCRACAIASGSSTPWP